MRRGNKISKLVKIACMVLAYRPGLDHVVDKWYQTLSRYRGKDQSWDSAVSNYITHLKNSPSPETTSELQYVKEQLKQYESPDYWQRGWEESGKKLQNSKRLLNNYDLSKELSNDVMDEIHRLEIK